MNKSTHGPLSAFIGTCHPPSPLYASRAAALAAGIPSHVPISTVNRLCSSGLMAIRNVAHSIKAGETTLGLAAGVESMSLKYVFVVLVQSRFSSPTQPKTYSRSFCLSRRESGGP